MPAEHGWAVHYGSQFFLPVIIMGTVFSGTFAGVLSYTPNTPLEYRVTWIIITVLFAFGGGGWYFRKVFFEFMNKDAISLLLRRNTGGDEDTYNIVPIEETVVEYDHEKYGELLSVTGKRLRAWMFEYKGDEAYIPIRDLPDVHDGIMRGSLVAADRIVLISEHPRQHYMFPVERSPIVVGLYARKIKIATLGGVFVGGLKQIIPPDLNPPPWYKKLIRRNIDDSTITHTAYVYVNDHDRVTREIQDAAKILVDETKVEQEAGEVQSGEGRLSIQFGKSYRDTLNPPTATALGKIKDWVIDTDASPFKLEQQAAVKEKNKWKETAQKELAIQIETGEDTLEEEEEEEEYKTPWTLIGAIIAVAISVLAVFIILDLFGYIPANIPIHFFPPPQEIAQTRGR